MPCLVIRCGVWDLTLTLELAADLPVQGLLVALDRQEEVGPLGVDEVFSAGVAAVKNDCVVCRATPSEKAVPTAWIRTPSISRLASNSLRVARSLDSPVSYAF